MNRPKCQNEMENGYSGANAALSWTEKKKFKSFVFIDKNLSEAGFRKFLPWKGYWFKAWNCRVCQIVIIDYSNKFDRKTVEAELRPK